MPEKARAKNRRQRLYFKISNRISERLLKKMIANTNAVPMVTFPKVLALCIAGLVYLLILAVAISGISLLRDHYNNDLFLSVVGVVLIVSAFVMRPRVGGPPERNILSKERFPTLYKLTDEIAARLGAKQVDTIIINTRYNAFFTRVGWSRMNILCIGMPLFEVLTPQERVALIAHELAHSANGDASRSFIIGSAIRSLKTWHSWFASDGDRTLMMLPVTYICLGIPTFAAMLFGLIASVLVLLLAGDSQRAEYLADSMAARVGGTQAILDVLRKLHMEDAIGMALDRFYEIKGKQGVFEILRRKVENVPPREIERVAQLEKSVTSRLDASHPPLAYRMELLRVQPIAQPALVISTADAEAIESELSKILPYLESLMLEDHKRRTDW